MHNTSEVNFMIKHTPVLIIILSLTINLQLSLGQSYVADTIRINIQQNDSIKFRHSLKVVDYRMEDPRFISVYEKKKWLFFPVDQIVIANRPIAEDLMRYQDEGSHENYLLTIHEYYIRQSASLFKKNFALNAALELSELRNTDTTLLGTFYYEQAFLKSKKTGDSAGYAEAHTFYMNQIIRDIDTVCENMTTIIKPGNFHFRSGAKAASGNLYLTNDLYIGYDFWGLDAELYFSSPEPADKFSRKSYLLRYLNYGNRESLAISGKVSLFNYRLSNNWLFQNKHAFLLGFNKWHDIDEAKRTFEEIFLFQLTATQRIFYNKIDGKGFVFGIGLMEDASYIIYNKPSYHIGFVMSWGYKF
jgi:hypothetical protein